MLTALTIHRVPQAWTSRHPANPIAAATQVQRHQQPVKQAQIKSVLVLFDESGLRLAGVLQEPAPREP